MNVMTVTDAAEPQLPAKGAPQEPGAQDFAQQLTQAASTQQAGGKGETKENASDTGPSDGSPKADDEKNKDAGKKSTPALQGAIPVITQIQAQAAAQTPAEDSGSQAATQATAQIPVETLVQPTATPVQAPQAQTDAGAMQVPVQTVLADGQPEADGQQTVQVEPQAVQQAEGDQAAVAFVRQAMNEIGALRKAAVTDGQQEAQAPGKAIGLQVNAPEQQEAQPAQELAAQAQEDAKDGQAGQDAKKDAQPQKTEILTGQAHAQAAAQAQTNIWGNANSNVSQLQYHVPKAEQSAVQRNIVTSIVDNITTATDKGTTEMVVQLKPEHLGGLAITLSMGDDGITAKMVTSQQSVQHMIQSQIGALQDTLNEKGIQVVHMEVIYDQSSSSTTSGNGGQNGQWATPYQNGDKNSYQDADESANYYNFMSSYDVLAEHGGSVEFSA